MDESAADAHRRILLACNAEQTRETLSVNEVRLVRIVQPGKNFFDEQRLFDCVWFGDVDMSERGGKVTSLLHEMSECQRCSMEM